jgi:hypothetical protein
MTSQLIALELTLEQKGQICGILSVGCDRETAAAFIGCSPADIARAMRHDDPFANDVRRTEASAELSHMRNVQQAAKDVKNWRASVWWLERRSPERFGARSPGTITSRHLKTFIQMLADNVNEDVQDIEDRQRILERFEQIQRFAEHLADDLTTPQMADDALPSSLSDDCSSELDLADDSDQLTL